MKVLFFLPSRGGNGGAHSVVQECLGMQRYGVAATLAVLKDSSGAFKTNYPDLETNGVTVVEAETAPELADLLTDQDVAVATTFESAHVLNAALGLAKKRPFPAYYVQDYEPLFCSPGTVAWERAISSYSAIPDALLFAKTDWLCKIVRSNTGVPVHRVLASVDHNVYFPSRHQDAKRVTISAMVRPKTRRRAPIRTARIMEKLHDLLGQSVDLVVFGATDQELNEAGISLGSGITNLGPLSRNEVANALRASDVFLDLSDYQAFGRTGIEAMACGCVPLLPLFGGANEYVENWRNAIMVDTRSDAQILEATKRFIEMSPEGREEMRSAGIAKSLEYTVERAAFSEVQLFRRIMGRDASSSSASRVAQDPAVMTN
jgi:glycosyltransferase involved in cell wall biosynthesis